jgi:hypothetical protein
MLSEEGFNNHARYLMKASLLSKVVWIIFSNEKLLWKKFTWVKFVQGLKAKLMHLGGS